MKSNSIFLYGPSGAGKTTIGRILSDQLGLPFHDLDQEIEVRLNRTIPEIFRDMGEDGFRIHEQLQLQLLLQSKVKSIVSLGGGTLLDPENRHMVEEQGSVIVLHSSIEHLSRRLRNDPHARPLLAENLEEKLSQLLQSREGHYTSFASQLNTSDLSPEQAVRWIQTRIGHYHLKSMGEYDVLVTSDSLDLIGEELKARKLAGPIALVCDENIAGLYAGRVRDSLVQQDLEVASIVLPAGEQHKNIQTISRLWSDFLGAGLERTSTVVALGGGVISDMAGFAASTYLRGIRWVAVPTTLLAMADASMGGKTGIDLPEGKNLAGSFHPPSLVLQDPEVLRTLSIEELRSGLGEVMKHGIISDPPLWETCIRLGDPAGWGEQWNEIGNVVRRAVAVKVDVIESDPYEKGRRAVLNYGHTVGHAIEVLSNFSIRHGDCVATGMVVEAQMSELLGLAQSGLTEEIVGGLQRVGLPTAVPGSQSVQKIMRVMQYDKKKSGGKVKFALPVQPGEVREGMEVDDRTIETAILSHLARA